MWEFVAAACALALTVTAAADRRADPPAADPSPTAFFVKAAESRACPPDLGRAAGKTLLRAARFLLSDTGIDNNAIRDEAGHKVPPYIYHAVIDGDDHFGYRASFPAYHHAYLIEAFLDYFNYTGDARGVARARELADWTIAHSSPAGCKWPDLPWSTFTEGKPGGGEDHNTLQPDKVGYMGLAYTRLYEVTGEPRYLSAAKAAAKTLVMRQNWDGSWPFRVDPLTGEVYQQYTAALFMNVAFLEKMYALTGDLDDKNAQISAWLWMLRNPVRTNNWSGLYEDIPKGSGSQVHYSPLQTIRLLLRYRTPINGASYLAKARALYDTTMDGLAFHDPDLGLILREQTGYLAATPSSTLNWTMMSAEFFLTTGEERYRSAVLEGVRMVTRYGLKPNGRSHNTVMGGWMYGDWGSWYSLTSPVVRYIYQDMGCLPELAPAGETHLLRSSTQIRRIAYRKRGVSYESLPGSIELLKLASAPRRVRAGGKDLRASADMSRPDCCTYNPRSGVLLVRHRDPRVEVTLMR